MEVGRSTIKYFLQFSLVVAGIVISPGELAAAQQMDIFATNHKSIVLLGCRCAPASPSAPPAFPAACLAAHLQPEVVCPDTLTYTCNTKLRKTQTF